MPNPLFLFFIKKCGYFHKKGSIFMEIWKDIEGFPMYEVSNKGKVRNKKTNHILSPKLTKQGYNWVGLMKDGKRFYLQNHRLVAFAFLNPPREGETQVNHKNKIKTDNRAENLEWSSPQYNTWHAFNWHPQYQQLNLFTGEWEDCIG